MKDSEIYCPKCQAEIWDYATGYKLNKCWNCFLAFDNESALVAEDVSHE